MGSRTPLAIVLLLTCLPAVQAQVVRQVTDLRQTRTSSAAVDDAGTVAFSLSDADPAGTNPNHDLQVFRWNLATGQGGPITSFAGGAAFLDGHGPSVTDDGSTVAFVMDGRIALVDGDGGGFVQLTTTPATIHHLQIAGNGSRVVFDSPDDLTGANSQGIVQVFAVEADGSDLRQLTSHTSHVYGTAWPTISDDGGRIAYLASQGSSDGNAQVAGILQDGSGFHWLTAWENLRPGWLTISGNGQMVAFQAEGAPPGGMDGCTGGSQIAIVEWNGTGLATLDSPCNGSAAPGWAGAPDITDDAQTVFYAAQRIGILDIWKINRDRSGWAPVTETALEPPPLADCDGFPRVAGGGSRALFTCIGGEPWGGPNPDRSRELYDALPTGTGHRQLSDTVAGDSFEPDLTPDGNRIVFASSANPLGEAGSVGVQVYRMAPDGSAVARVTALSGLAAAEPTGSDSGEWIAFTARRDGFVDRVFTVRDDGTALTELAPGASQSSNQPQMSPDGSFVVFASGADLLGEGLSAGSRIYRANRNGSGLARVSAAATDFASSPRLDGTGTWVVYVRAGRVHRTRTDGSADQQITTVGTASGADILPGGGRVVYAVTGDPLGTNPEGNEEIFLWEEGAGTTRQLTSTATGRNRVPTSSRDGMWAAYWYDAVEEPEPYRVELATGSVERIGGLPACAAYRYGASPPPVVMDREGAIAVYSGPGDCAGVNRDGSEEVFAVDRTVSPGIHVSPGPAPTTISWDVEPAPSSYDVIRGDVDSLARLGDGSVDLGAVVCVEDDSKDASTSDSPDPDTPLPGQVFFYLVRGTPGSYGRSSGGGERIPSSGDCPE